LVLNGGIDFKPIPGKTPPVSFDPAYPQRGEGNQRGVMERMSDAENANLKDWAKVTMRKYNQDVLDGHRAFSSQSRCWPGGTPGQLLFPAEPIFFVQTPKEVWIIWQRQQEVRRIYLNQQHSRNPKPSWFGESVGHYENGELVIDTIGFLDKHMFDFVDNWRTPHTKDMHVVERWKLIDGGKGIEATVHGGGSGHVQSALVGDRTVETRSIGGRFSSRFARKITARSRHSSTCRNIRSRRRRRPIFEPLREQAHRSRWCSCWRQKKRARC
jgi:hypothetical protein